MTWQELFYQALPSTSWNQGEPRAPHRAIRSHAQGLALLDFTLFVEMCRRLFLVVPELIKLSHFITQRC